MFIYDTEERLFPCFNILHLQTSHNKVSYSTTKIFMSAAVLIGTHLQSINLRGGYSTISRYYDHIDQDIISSCECFTVQHSAFGSLNSWAIPLEGITYRWVSARKTLTQSNYVCLALTHRYGVWNGKPGVSFLPALASFPVSTVQAEVGTNRQESLNDPHEKKYCDALGDIFPLPISSKLLRTMNVGHTCSVLLLLLS